MSTTIVVLLLAVAAGSAQPVQTARSNSTCNWPAESHNRLGSNYRAQQKGLTRDAEFAEDLAIRYADACCGPHSGHFEGMAEYGQKRDGCMAMLFQIVARDHGVSVDQVRRSLSDRPKIFDLTVILSYAVLYALAAYLIAHRLWKLYSGHGDRQRGVIMAVYVSAITSAVGMLLLTDVWSAAMENIRIGNGHLSYRGARIPWQYHRPAIFISGVLLFWAAAALRYRVAFSVERSS